MLPTAGLLGINVGIPWAEPGSFGEWLVLFLREELLLDFSHSTHRIPIFTADSRLMVSSRARIKHDRSTSIAQ